jgi:cytochrome oxidase Cu insertion factor (SCO1/SenC/PrrC family)
MAAHWRHLAAAWLVVLILVLVIGVGSALVLGPDAAQAGPAWRSVTTPQYDGLRIGRSLPEEVHPDD